MKENFYTKNSLHEVQCTRSIQTGGVRNRILMIFFALFVLQGVSYAQHCTPSPSAYDGSGVTNVTIGSLSNSSTLGTPTYEDYSSMSAVVSPGDVVSVSVTLTTGGFPYSIGVWIDWNNDFDFDDENEFPIYEFMVTGLSGATFTVPLDVASGSYKLRVGANDEDWGSPLQPCYTGDFGNYEDYNVLVLGEGDCAPVTELEAALNSTSTALVTWTPPAGTPDSYNIYVSESSMAPDESTIPTYDGITGTEFTLEDLLPNITYYIFVQSVCASGNSVWTGPVTVYSGYCVPTTSFSGDYISNFSTDGAIVNIDNSTSNAVAYSDFSELSIQHYANSGFDFSTSYVGGTNGVNIWIDWNNDYVFDESENVFSQSDNGATTIGSIAIPDGTALGEYRLRVRSQWGFGTNPPPCGDVTWGETEDYTLVVIESPSCIPPTGLTGTMVQGEMTTLSWTASVSEPANGYAWFLVEQGAGPEGTQVASGTTEAGVTTAEASGLVDFTAYDLYVSAICADDESAWAGPYTLPIPCTTTLYGQFPGGITFQPTCNGTVNTITTCAFASEYALVQVEEGEEYIFGISVASDIITITNADASEVLAVGIGNVTWTSTISGVVRFHTHTPGCGNEGVCRIKTVQCGEPWVEEADIEILYTLGGLPLVFGDSHVVQALITNPAADTWTKEITLTVEGANTFTSVYELTLAGNSSELISFDPFTATNAGTQTVTVSVEDDNVNSNNTYSVEQLVTPNLFSHKEPNAPTVEGGVGIGGGFTGNFVAKFTTSAPGEINEIKVDFEGNGGISYQYRVFAADGPGGLPETVLFDSEVMISAPGQAFLPVSPAVPVTGDFYVGLRELGTNFQFAYQDESPLRSGVFYFMTEDGTFPWTDISTSGAPTARLAIEAQMYTETAPNCAINTSPENGSLACHLAGTTLSWSSGGGAPTGYHLYFGTEEDPEFVADVTETTYEVAELTENTVYYWYVVPFNEFGDGDCSEVMSFTAEMGGCYCVPTYLNGTEFSDLISNVEILGTTLANNTGTAPGTPAYTYFTGEPNYTADLQAGTSYTVSVSVGDVGGQNVAVWIDYNDNGSFEENEKAGFTTAPIAFLGTATFAINLDCTAPLGMHRMRVRDVWNVAGNLIDPCLEYGYGETEDYDITIIEAPACPAPNNGALSYVTDVSATLTWNAGCFEDQWNVHVGLAGEGAPTGDPSHPNVVSPLDVDGLTPFTSYEFWVMAICDDENSSDWAGPFFFSTLLLPPPVNDNPCGAIPLTISQDCNYEIFTNVDASNTPNVPDPTCSFYDGSDVWFSVVVPGNGILTLDTQEGGITDLGMAVYAADTCNGVFTQVGCNDDDSPTGGTWMPYIELSGLTPGDILYVRVFSYGNFEFGEFGICATTPCSAPINIEVDILTNTATITWPSMGEGASYNWELRLTGDAGSGEDGLVQSGTTEVGVTTITITDLDYLTIYNFYLSTNCSEETTSEWSPATEIVIVAMPGCTNPEACNYDPAAGEDDGSCVLEVSNWYMDADGDGKGDATTEVEACLAPEGYIADGTDCDDTDETVWQSNTLYADADGDGYDIGSEVICYGAELPDGYSLETEGTDCDDDDSSITEQVVLEVALQLPITTVCNTSTAFSLTGGSPAGGAWTGSAGVSGGQFNPATAGAGTHTITYTVAGDGVCVIGGSASSSIVVEICPGIDEASLDEIQLYPTYTNGNVTVVGSDLKEAMIMDLNGKLINTVSLNNTSIISMQEYSAGIYFVRVVGENRVRTFKVVRVN